MTRIIRTILILIIGSITSYMYYMLSYKSGINENLRILGMLTIGLALLIWSVIVDFFSPKNKGVKLFSRYLTVTLCAVFIAIFIALNSYYRSILESETLIKIYCKPQRSLEWQYLDLKTSGTFVLSKQKGMFITTIIIGKYSISNNNISLTPNLQAASTSNKTTIMLALDSLKTDSLYIVDKFNLIDKSSNFYNIMEDNR